MLRATPKAWWSYDYTISDGVIPVAELSRGFFRERAALLIHGQTYTVIRVGARGPWVLRDPDGRELASAQKPSVWRDGLDVRAGEHVLRFERRSLWRRHFVLREGEAEVGTIRQESFWSRTALIELPEGLGLPVQAFLTLLMLFLWQREDAGAVTTSVTT